MKYAVMALLLAGCATSQPVTYMSQDCKGRDVTIRLTEYLSYAPTIDCANLAAQCGASPVQVALMTVQMPVACAYRGPLCSFVVLPVVGADLLRSHEYDHLMGKSHPPFLPLPPTC